MRRAPALIDLEPQLASSTPEVCGAAAVRDYEDRLPPVTP
jgi:hypothetical protein